jgi:hypothetical protein
VSVPVNARVRAVPNFLVCLRVAQNFMAEQDAASAPERFGKLQAELRKARDLLSFAPTSGRPARFLQAETDWARFQAQQASQLAKKIGLPGLRELVLARHVVLYAHSDREVLLVSLRHERQLGYYLLHPHTGD